MKILSLNSHSLVENNWDEKMEYIAQKIHLEGYDVIALQEVNQTVEEKLVDVQELEECRYVEADETTKVRKDNFAYKLVSCLQELGEVYHWTFAISHIGYGIYEEGLALLSREPILDTQSLVVSKETNRISPETRRQVGITICYQEQKIAFYSVHFGWWKKGEERFSNQWDQFCRQICLNESGIIYVMGDFNNPAGVREEGYDYIMKDRIWKDTWDLNQYHDSCVTTQGFIDGWKKEKHGKRIDFILKNMPLEKGKFNIVFNGINGFVVSDHFGVEVEEIS